MGLVEVEPAAPTSSAAQRAEAARSAWAATSSESTAGSSLPAGTALLVVPEVLYAVAQFIGAHAKHVG